MLDGLSWWLNGSRIKKEMEKVESVRRMTMEFFTEGNVFYGWLLECTVRDGSSVTPFEKLYESFRPYCENYGEKEVIKPCYFSRYLKQAVFPAVAKNRPPDRQGIRLKREDNVRGDQEPQVIRFPQSPLQRVLQEEGYRVAQSEEGPNGEVLEEEGEDQEPF